MRGKGSFFDKTFLEFLGVGLELKTLVDVDNVGAIYLAEDATHYTYITNIDQRCHLPVVSPEFSNLKRFPTCFESFPTEVTIYTGIRHSFC